MLIVFKVKFIKISSNSVHINGYILVNVFNILLTLILNNSFDFDTNTFTVHLKVINNLVKLYKQINLKHWQQCNVLFCDVISVPTFKKFH